MEPARKVNLAKAKSEHHKRLNRSDSQNEALMKIQQSQMKMNRVVSDGLSYKVRAPALSVVKVVTDYEKHLNASMEDLLNDEKQFYENYKTLRIKTEPQLRFEKRELSDLKARFIKYSKMGILSKKADQMKGSFVLNPDFSLKKSRRDTILGKDEMDMSSEVDSYPKFNYLKLINRQLPQEHIKKYSNKRVMQLE